MHLAYYFTLMPKLTAQCLCTVWFPLVAEKTFGCFYDNDAYFTILCNRDLKLYIQNTTLGRSAADCLSNKMCCPSRTVCTIEAETTHLQSLKDTCDGKGTCRVSVGQQWCNNVYTDYETVTYICSDTNPGKLIITFLIFCLNQASSVLIIPDYYNCMLIFVCKYIQKFNESVKIVMI